MYCLVALEAAKGEFPLRIPVLVWICTSWTSTLFTWRRVAENFTTKNQIIRQNRNEFHATIPYMKYYKIHLKKSKVAMERHLLIQLLYLHFKERLQWEEIQEPVGDARVGDVRKRRRV